MEISYRSLIIGGGGGGGGGRNRGWGINIIPPFILCWRRLISPPPPTENCVISHKNPPASAPGGDYMYVMDELKTILRVRSNRFPRGGGGVYFLAIGQAIG